MRTGYMTNVILGIVVISLMAIATIWNKFMNKNFKSIGLLLNMDFKKEIFTKESAKRFILFIIIPYAMYVELFNVIAMRYLPMLLTFVTKEKISKTINSFESIMSMYSKEEILRVKRGLEIAFRKNNNLDSQEIFLNSSVELLKELSIEIKNNSNNKLIRQELKSKIDNYLIITNSTLH